MYADLPQMASNLEQAAADLCLMLHFGVALEQMARTAEPIAACSSAQYRQ
jgi:hypothetical protein